MVAMNTTIICINIFGAIINTFAACRGLEKLDSSMVYVNMICGLVQAGDVYLLMLDRNLEAGKQAEFELAFAQLFSPKDPLEDIKNLVDRACED